MNFSELRTELWEISKKYYNEIDSQTLDDMMNAVEKYVDTALSTEEELRGIRNKGTTTVTRFSPLGEAPAPREDK